jgi:hypothetical protein
MKRIGKLEYLEEVIKRKIFQPKLTIFQQIKK